jgi:hypothetical protein
VTAEQVGLLSPDKVQPLSAAADEVGRMLRALIRPLEKRIEANVSSA